MPLAEWLPLPQESLKSPWVRFTAEQHSKHVHHFYQSLGYGIVRRADKETCDKGEIPLLTSSAQIWRASHSSELERKTRHGLEFLVLLVCFNSRLMHKH